MVKKVCRGECKLNKTLQDVLLLHTLSYIIPSVKHIVMLTFVELEAERCSRARAGVMDRLLAQVIPGTHVTPELNQQLDHLQIVSFSGMVEGRLVDLCSIYICTFR